MIKTTWMGNEGFYLLNVQVQQQERFSSANMPYLHRYSLDLFWTGLLKHAVATVSLTMC